MGSRVLLYNPLNMSKQEVFGVFTAREDQAAFILKSIKDQTDYKTPQHYLIIGPRGTGKTILLRYLHCKIQDDTYLNTHWEVVQFSEEEYGIRTLADFFRKIVERLLEHYEESELVDILGQVIEDEELVNDCESYQFLIARFCSMYNKRILVFADNFDYIIRKNISEQERAGLRKYLLLQNHVVLVATTVSLFNELEQYEEPFFDFFAPVKMNRLTMEQGIELIRKRAEMEAPDRPPVQQLLSTWKTQVPKFKAIIQLTDGNPRLLLMLYEILKGNPLQKVLDVFNWLLDDLTPYIKAQLDQLSGMQQKIVDTLARSDSGYTPTMLAAEAGIDVRKVSSQLVRLEEDMAFVKKEKHRKKTYYVIGNKLFRTWYQMRVVRKKIKIYRMLVSILEYWFSDEEIIRQLQGCSGFEEKRYYIAELKDAKIKEEYAIRLAAEHVKAGRLDDAKEELEYFLPGSEGEFRYGVICAEEGKFEEAEKIFKKKADEGIVEAIFNLARLYQENKKYKLSEKYYLIAVERGSVQAMNNLALLYANQDEAELAEKYYLMAVEKGHIVAMNNLALLYAKQDKAELAEKYYLMAVDRGYVVAMNNLALLYWKKGLINKAEKTYNDS